MKYFKHRGQIFKHREAVTCTIEGKPIKNAKISIEGANVFICQNIKSGAVAHNRLGYRYSWIIHRSIGESVETFNVLDLRHAYNKPRD